MATLSPVNSLEERSALVVGQKNILSSTGVFEATKAAVSPGGEVSKPALEAAIRSLSPSAASDSGDTVRRPLGLCFAGTYCGVL